MGVEALLLQMFQVELVEEPTLVTPSQPTDNHVYFLSNLDQNVAVTVETVYFYAANPETSAMAGEDPARVLKEALRKVLVHYYPLAGRLGISLEGKLNVHYNGEGVVFVEARANAPLTALGNLRNLNPVELNQLVYRVPGSKSILDIPPAVVQVTKFECGGFVLGFGVNHAMVDGIAAMEFVNSWAETARGLSLSIPPILDRTLLKARSPPQIKFPHTEFLDVIDPSPGENLLFQDEALIHKSFCFTIESLDHLKKEAMEDGTLSKCTTFQALSGLVWKARSEAMEMKPDEKTKLLFAVDGRAKFKPPLPKGYMGNGIVLTFALTSAGELIRSPISYAVKQIQEAIALVDDEYMRSAIDFFEVIRRRPSLAMTMVITTWSKLAFNTADFGWGEPTYAGPVTLPEKEVVLFLSPNKPRESISVLLGLPPLVMLKFEEILQPYLL